MPSHIKEDFEDRRAHYASMHGQMREGDRFFYQQFDGLIDVPYEVQIFRSATAANIVEGFRNQIRTSEPTVDFHATGPSVAAVKHSVTMQKWGYAQLRRERQFSALEPNLQCGFDLLLRGATGKKITHNVDMVMEPPPRRGTRAFKEWEERALRTTPFVSRTIDPLSLYPAPGVSKPLPSMIERQVRFAGEIMRMYPNWVNPDKKKLLARHVEWLERWDEDEYSVEADGNEVFTKENPYGFVPYIYEWSGLGREHADNDPRYMAMGILTLIVGELAQEIRLKTAISVQTQMHVFPPILTVEDPRKVAQQFGVGPGKVIRHPPGHPPEYMKFPPPNDNMYQFLAVIHENIARVQSKALAGGREPGVRFGVLNAQMIGQALTAIAPVIATVNTIGTRTLNMMAAIARKLDLHMAIQGTQEAEGELPIRVSGEDFTALNFEVSFEAVDPAENDRALLVGEALRRNGDITQRTLWKKYAKHVVEDPDAEEVGLLKESILRQLVESGQLSAAVLSEDVQAQMLEQIEESVDDTQDVITQNRRVESIPVAAATQATELEALSGRPGSLTIPREAAEQGMATATPGRSGLPRS